MSLKLGRIAYLNVIPYFHFLRDVGFTGDIISGVPAELNRMLAEGVIDACPSSSFEYGVHSEDYLLLPGHSISSIGPVQSVLFFCHGGLGNLAGSRIALTGESATSVNLLKILLQEFCGISGVRCEVPEEPVEEALAAGQNALLIGDRALQMASRCPADVQVVDLGVLWYHFTGLPFVFALWIVRRESVADHHEQFRHLLAQLSEARNRAFGQIEVVAAEVSPQAVLDKDALIRYWQSMSYDLTDGHLEGLQLYFTLCKKYELLSDVPQLNFLEFA